MRKPSANVIDRNLLNSFHQGIQELALGSGFTERRPLGSLRCILQSD